MTKQVVAKYSTSGGIVQLEECVSDNDAVTYNVFLLRTVLPATSKNIREIESIEDACRIYNEYSEELTLLKKQQRERKIIIQVQ